MLRLTKNIPLNVIFSIKYYLPALAWAILIFSLSTSAPIELPKFDLLGADKIGHFAAYCILTLLLVIGTIYSFRWKKIEVLPMFVLFLVASLYGASLEFVQAQLPQRSFDYADMLANCIGALLGCGLTLFIKRFLLF